MSGGYLYGEQQPTVFCPYCGIPCDADFVDIGVGFQQCGPYHCTECGASEIGPYDEERELTEQEKKTHWYAPGQPPGSSANVIGGKVISHRIMREAYRREFVGNSLYHWPGYVADWWKRVREKGIK